MPLALVPIPLDCLEGTRPHWRPFLEAVANRIRGDLAGMEKMLFSEQMQAFLVWDSVASRALAFLGVNYIQRGHRKIAELLWLAGENRKAWLHLFADLETYLRDHQNCVAIESKARPGWTKPLKANGYRLAFQVMEKELSHV